MNINDESVKISFVYPSFAVKDSETLGPPQISIKSPGLPCRFQVIASVGIVGFSVANQEKEYSICADVFFNEERVTDPEEELSIISHVNNLSDEGINIATFGIPLHVNAPAPGVYTLKLSLYEQNQGNKSVSLDEMECVFVVSSRWEV